MPEAVAAIAAREVARQERAQRAESRGRAEVGLEPARIGGQRRSRFLGRVGGPLDWNRRRDEAIFSAERANVAYQQRPDLAAEPDGRLRSGNLERSGKLRGFGQFLGGELRQHANGLLDLLEALLDLRRGCLCPLLELGEPLLARGDELVGLVEPPGEILDHSTLRFEQLALFVDEAGQAGHIRRLGSGCGRHLRSGVPRRHRGQRRRDDENAAKRHEPGRHRHSLLRFLSHLHAERFACSSRIVSTVIFRADTIVDTRPHPATGITIRQRDRFTMGNLKAA